MSNESKGMILGFLGVAAFGLTLPATRFIVPYFDPIFIGLGRAVIASVVAAIILIARITRLVHERTDSLIGHRLVNKNHIIRRGNDSQSFVYF